MNIDLTNISAEELMNLWNAANANANANANGVITSVKTAKEEMNEYIDWLESGCFGSQLMNDLGYELGTMMCSVYVHGASYEVYDESGVWIGTKVYEVDKENPNTKELFEFCLNGFKEDTDYLTELGITKKKPTKKCPYSFNDIDWSVFNK